MRRKYHLRKKCWPLVQPVCPCRRDHRTQDQSEACTECGKVHPLFPPAPSPTSDFPPQVFRISRFKFSTFLRGMQHFRIFCPRMVTIVCKTCMCLNIGNQGNLDSKPDCSPLYLCSSCPNLIIGASKRNTLWSALFPTTKKCSNIFLWCEQRLNVNILFLGNLVLHAWPELVSFLVACKHDVIVVKPIIP